MKRPKENGANIITKRVMVLPCFPAALTDLELKKVFSNTCQNSIFAHKHFWFVGRCWEMIGIY